jgi:hypothetical protein
VIVHQEIQHGTEHEEWDNNAPMQLAYDGKRFTRVWCITAPHSKGQSRVAAAMLAQYSTIEQWFDAEHVQHN